MCPSAVQETKINVTRFEYLTFEADAQRTDQREERHTRGGQSETHRLTLIRQGKASKAASTIKFHGFGSVGGGLK